MEKKKEADRRRGGKTISKSGQEWTLPAQLGQLKTGQDGKGLLRIHLWCPDDLPRLWDRIENRRAHTQSHSLTFLKLGKYELPLVHKILEQ